MDALKFFATTIKKPRVFIYLDPPYFVKGRKLYKNFYEPKDHEVIARALGSARRASWVVSYDDVSQIRKLYGSFASATYRLNYSAGEKGQGTEIIFASDAIDLPRFEGFKRAA